LRQSSILSGIILLGCVFLSLTIVMAGFEQSKDVTKAQNNLKTYKEKMSNPVNALDPLSYNGGGSIGQLIIPKLGVDATIRSDVDYTQARCGRYYTF